MWPWADLKTSNTVTPLSSSHPDNVSLSTLDHIFLLVTEWDCKPRYIPSWVHLRVCCCWDRTGEDWNGVTYQCVITPYQVVITPKWQNDLGNCWEHFTWYWGTATYTFAYIAPIRKWAIWLRLSENIFVFKFLKLSPCNDLGVTFDWPKLCMLTKAHPCRVPHV